MHEAHRQILPRALDSLAKQTYTANLLVVNDATTPLALEGITVLNTGGNKGTAYARNLALDAVETPLVFFMDADDYLLPPALELLHRAYIEYDEACYIYSDWYQYGKNGEFKEYKAKPYDRQKLLRHSLHLVNILIGTDTAKTVYYDINYRGWEDWEFHIRLGLNGFCGERVTEPLLVYDMTTSINREAHNAIQHDVYAEIINKYDDYLKGAKEFMACSSCGKDKMRVARVGPSNPMPPPQDGYVVMEYLGDNTAPTSFKVGGRIYRGARDDTNRFVQVLAEDVAGLMARGPWRRAVRAAAPITPPKSEEFNKWREVNKTEVPQDWADLFKKNAKAPPSVANETTETIQPPKPRARRTKAAQRAAARGHAD